MGTITNREFTPFLETGLGQATVRFGTDGHSDVIRRLAASSLKLAITRH